MMRMVGMTWGEGRARQAAAPARLPEGPRSGLGAARQPAEPIPPDRQRASAAGASRSW